MLIGFTGPQCSGKSTLLKQMLHSDRYRKCTFIKEVTRKVAAAGYAINDQGDDVTQLFILNEHLNNHHLTGCAVLDRCIVDGYIYTKWLHSQQKVSDWVLTYAEELHSLLINKIDLILYPDPHEIDLVDDGQRSARVDFREQITSLYVDYFADNPDVYNKTLTLSGTIDQRFKTLQQHLKTYDKIR